MKGIILLIHGLRGDRHGLSELGDELKKRGYHVLNPNLPGSGDAEALSNKTLAGYATWLHEYVRKHDVKPYIIGHSMGSIIVTHYLEKYPKDVQQKVVAISPIFRTRIQQKSSNLTYALASGALNSLPKSTRYKIMKSRRTSYVISHYLTTDKKQQKRIDQLHYMYSGNFASTDSLLADMRISMKEQTITPIGKEMLYIIGDHDRLTKSELARYRAAAQGARIIEIRGAGHLVNYEQPEKLAEVIDEYLDMMPDDSENEG